MLSSTIFLLLSCLFSLVCGLPTTATYQANHTERTSPESAYFRDYFYAGGSYTDDGTGAGTHVFQGQMYVERLTRLKGANHTYPLVFIHGAGQSGTVSSRVSKSAFIRLHQLIVTSLLQNFLNTPDGRKGWASWLIDRGYEVRHAREAQTCSGGAAALNAPLCGQVYIIDQVARARSMWLPGNGTMSFFSAEVIEQRFTATQDFNLWPQASLHSQWPGVRLSQY